MHYVKLHQCNMNHKSNLFYRKRTIYNCYNRFYPVKETKIVYIYIYIYIYIYTYSLPHNYSSKIIIREFLKFFTNCCDIFSCSSWKCISMDLKDFSIPNKSDEIIKLYNILIYYQSFMNFFLNNEN